MKMASLFLGQLPGGACACRVEESLHGGMAALRWRYGGASLAVCLPGRWRYAQFKRQVDGASE
jgi:hypothetical protein